MRWFKSLYSVKHLLYLTSSQVVSGKMRGYLYQWGYGYVKFAPAFLKIKVECLRGWVAKHSCVQNGRYFDIFPLNHDGLEKVEMRRHEDHHKGCFFFLSIFAQKSVKNHMALHEGFRTDSAPPLKKHTCYTKKHETCVFPWEDFMNLGGLFLTRWWFQICFIFTPTCGNDPIWQYNIFQMGWFNHQLVKMVFWKYKYIYIYIHTAAPRGSLNPTGWLTRYLAQCGWHREVWFRTKPNQAGAATGICKAGGANLDGSFGISGFPKMVVPNNHWFSYWKWSFLGCFGGTTI